MNAGAILNRINFGLALAGGRLPGASLAQWPETEHLRGASREQQVDAVIGAMLGGHVSPDTRSILLNGENPLAAKLAGSVDSAAVNAVAMAESDDASPMRPMTRRQPGAAFARPVQLEGLAQVVGLAIGAPEFQRR